MGILDELQAQQQDPFSSLADLSATPSNLSTSLADAKRQRLSQVRVDKQDRIDPSIRLEEYRKMVEGPGESGLLDLAEASLYRSAGNVADAGRGISNAIFGTEFDDSEATGLSNRELADERAGVSPETRAEAQAKYAAVGDAYDRGDVGDFLLSAVKAGPTALADSTGTLADLAIGGPMAKGAIKGLQFGARFLRSGEKVVDAKRSATTMSKSWDKAKAAGAEARSYSVLTADLVQQQRNAYIEEHGEQPPVEWVAGATLANMAAAMLQGEVLKRFFIPGGFKATAKDAQGNVISNPKILEQTVAEAKRLMTYAKEPALQSIKKEIQNGLAKVISGGAAEGAQEFVQTWVEILSVKMGPEQSEQFMDSLLKEINAENLREATIGSGLGLGAGTTAKTTITAPATAAKTAVHAGKGVTQAAASKLSEITNKGSLGSLSEQERKAAAEKYSNAKTVHEELRIRNEARIEALGQVRSFEDITDEQVRNDVLRDAQNKNLDVTKGSDLEKLLKGRIRNYKQEVVASRTAMEGDRALQMGKIAARDTKDAVVEAVGLTQEDIDKAVAAAKKAGIAIKDEVMNFDQSATAGVLEASMRYTSRKAKEAKADLERYAKELPPEAMLSIADSMPAEFALSAEVLRKKARDKSAAVAQTQTGPKKLYNKDSMPVELISVAKTGKIDGSRAAIGKTIASLEGATFEDRQSLKTALDAIKVYKKGPKGEGEIGADTLRRIEAKLRHRKKILKENKAVAAVKSLKSKAFSNSDAVKQVTGKLAESGQNMMQSLDKFIAGQLDEDYKHLVEIPSLKDPGKTYRFKTTAQRQNVINKLGLVGDPGKAIQKMKQAGKNQYQAARTMASALLGLMKADPRIIQSIADALHTTDTDVIMSFLATVNPVFLSEQNGPVLENLIRTQLEGYTVEPAPVGDAVPAKGDRSKKKTKSDTKAVPVESESQTEKAENATGKEEKEASDDNLSYTDAYLSDDYLNQIIDDIIGPENIC
jgi:hypothetical protein